MTESKINELHRATQRGHLSIEELSESFRKGGLSGRLRDFVAPDVLVIDEVGYLTYGDDAANMHFHVVNERYKRKRAMIFTTNKEVTEWGCILHDEDLAHAILDRVLERGQYIKLEGASGRTPHVVLDSKEAVEASRC